MSFLPTSRTEEEGLLSTIGVCRPDELFTSIPRRILLREPLAVEGPLDELTLRRRFLASSSPVSFAGGGIYRHYIPALVDALASRQEFLTAYTPYQPEISQGPSRPPSSSRA